MELTVEKWGDDLAVRLPAAVTEDLGLTEGCKVSVAKNRTRVDPQKDHTLAEVFAFRADGRHHAGKPAESQRRPSRRQRNLVTAADD